MDHIGLDVHKREGQIYILAAQSWPCQADGCLLRSATAPRGWRAPSAPALPNSKSAER
jgi:hypothetical protein